MVGAGRCGGWALRHFDISEVYLLEKHVEVLRSRAVVRIRVPERVITADG